MLKIEGKCSDSTCLHETVKTIIYLSAADLKADQMMTSTGTSAASHPAATESAEGRRCKIRNPHWLQYSKI